MALQVAEGAVVGDDLEAVAQRLEAAAGPVAAVGALSDQRRQQLGPLLAVEHVEPGEDLGLRRAGRLEEAGGEQVLFGPVDVDQLDRGGGRAAAAAVEAEPRDPLLGRWRGAAPGRRSTRRRGRAGRPARRSSASPAAARRRIIPPYSRASGSGEAISRMISCS